MYVKNYLVSENSNKKKIPLKLGLYYKKKWVSRQKINFSVYLYDIGLISTHFSKFLKFRRVQY